MTYQEDKAKAGQVWESLNREQRAEIYFKLVHHRDCDPICSVNFVNSSWYGLGGNQRKLTGMIIYGRKT